MLPFPADVDVLAVLVADRSALAAEHLPRPESDRRPCILVPGRRVNVPTEIDFGSGQGATPFLEVAETSRDRREFVAIGIGYWFRGLYTAGQASAKEKRNFVNYKMVNNSIIYQPSCERYSYYSQEPPFVNG